MKLVHLNVEGTLMTVEQETLAKAKYFKELFLSNFNDSSIFVPCSLDAFKNVVDFLRFKNPINGKYVRVFDYFGVEYDQEDVQENDTDKKARISNELELEKMKCERVSQRLALMEKLYHTLDATQAVSQKFDSLVVNEQDENTIEVVKRKLTESVMALADDHFGFDVFSDHESDHESDGESDGESDESVDQETTK